jgi:hypothetical protein
MKRNQNRSRLSRSFLLFAGVAGLGASALLLTAGSSRSGYVAHEWGTFTSVASADGTLLNWNPLESSRLPGFVYDWKKPGLGRQTASLMYLNKSSMSSLQRMETPVIYFYSSTPEQVDVSVDFPKGVITEWYPQAVQVGPSTIAVTPRVAKLDEYAHKIGVKPSFSFASLFSNRTVKESRVRWANVQILPANSNTKSPASFPLDRSGSHYFAARETDADAIQVSSLSATNPLPEQEKFLFYRGVGSFATPLLTSMTDDGKVKVANTGKDLLVHLFVLTIEKGKGNFIEIDRLSSGEVKEVVLKNEAVEISNLEKRLSKQLAAGLRKEGLYQREAIAMVNTWKDSWFAEDGTRVLYVLPRAWTDGILPMKLDPAPRQLVRVMVGRAEILSPLAQQNLRNALVKAKSGDGDARAEVIQQLKVLGRFASPALQLATRNVDREVMDNAWALYQVANHPATEPKPL